LEVVALWHQFDQFLLGLLVQFVQDGLLGFGGVLETARE
jgi:hypothetical protein